MSTIDKEFPAVEIPCLKEPEPAISEKIRRMRLGEQYLENNHGYWTEDECCRLEEMFHDGIGISEMALELGRTERTVMQKLNMLKAYGEKNRPRQRNGDSECLCRQCREYATCEIRVQAGQLCPMSDGLE